MSRARPAPDRWMLVGLVLVALALRLPPALANPVHPDEALYGYHGLLIANGRDPWLAHVPVYKPPLLPYLLAGAQGLLGNREFALRLPGLIAGLLAVPLAAALYRALYRDRWATAAAAAVALSPFAILLSATAFIDPLMVTLGLAACVAAARARPGWAGLLAGLAFAAKQTALAWLPLALGLGLVRAPTPRSIARFCGTFLAVAALLFVWDAVRVAQGAQSFWTLGVSGYGGLRLIWPHELGPRLQGWIGWVRYLFVSPLVNTPLLLGLPALVYRALTRHSRTRSALADLLLVSFLLVHLSLHWLWAFPIWDRYLLPLVPVLALLLARVLALLASFLRPQLARWSFAVGALSLIVLMALPACKAAASRYPIGGDHTVYEGIDQVVAFIERAPEGSVLYQHWLGWQYAYYLFDAPVYLAYWPTPAWLAEDVRVFGPEDPRYVAFPSWESPARVRRALADVGYSMVPLLSAPRRDGTISLTLYHVEPLTSR